MTMPSQPPTAEPRFSQLPLQEQSRRLFGYFRSLDGWLVLGTFLGMFAESMVLAAWAYQRLADVEAPVHWDDPLLLVMKALMVFAVSCGVLFLLRLLRLLQPWWTRIFPALTVLCIAFPFLALMLSMATPVSVVLVDALLPFDVVLIVCGTLGLLSLALAATLRPF